MGEQDLLEIEANRMALRIQHLLKQLESFSYSVAHDLRAPLRSMLGFTAAVIEDHGSVLPPDATELLKRVTASAKRMGQLVDSLLSLSRVARTEIRPQFVNLSAIATEIVAELRESQPDRKVRVSIAEGLGGLGDPGLLRIVLTNLIGNAWKFTSRTTEARIEFARTHGAKGLTYQVSDNGAGFDMTFAGKLFGTFQRLHSEEEFEGTGIGLAMVQTIIQRHGGEIWAEGAIGEGADFFFTLGKSGQTKGDNDG